MRIRSTPQTSRQAHLLQMRMALDSDVSRQLGSAERARAIAQRAYYSTGNIGMAPTRAYVDTAAPEARAWSFPITALDQNASFEEAAIDKVQLHCR